MLLGLFLAVFRRLRAFRVRPLHAYNPVDGNFANLGPFQRAFGAVGSHALVTDGDFDHSGPQHSLESQQVIIDNAVDFLSGLENDGDPQPPIVVEIMRPAHGSLIATVKDVLQKLRGFAANLGYPTGTATQAAMRVRTSQERNAGAEFNGYSAVSAHFETPTDAESMPTQHHDSRLLRHFRHRFTFLKRNGGNGHEGSTEVLDAGLFVDFLPFPVVVVDQVLNQPGNHPPMPRAHVHCRGNRNGTANGMTMMGHGSHSRPARARRQPQTVLGPFLRSAKTISIALALLSAPVFGQSSGFIQIYQATAPGTSANFSNINPKYNAWTVMYNYSGAGSFSIELDCAPDATVAGGTPTPGSFAACTNTVTGTNPATTPNYGYMTFVGYTPWLRLNVTAISSGNITAAAFGFVAADPESGGGGGGSAKQNCDPSTSSLTVTTATVTLSSSGLTQIIPATSGHKILICSAGISFASGVNFQLETGTGSNCGTSTTALTGTLQSITAITLDSTAAILTPTVSQAVCANLGSSVTGGGWVTYAVD